MVRLPSNYHVKESSLCNGFILHAYIYTVALEFNTKTTDQQLKHVKNAFILSEGEQRVFKFYC